MPYKILLTLCFPSIAIFCANDLWLFPAPPFPPFIKNTVILPRVHIMELKIENYSSINRLNMLNVLKPAGQYQFEVDFLINESLSQIHF